MDYKCGITGYAMHSIAGTEEEFNLESNKGYTNLKKDNWTKCIDQSDLEVTKRIILTTVKRAMVQANYYKIESTTISLVISSNFFGNAFWEKDQMCLDFLNNSLILDLKREFGINGIILSDSTACSSGGSAIVVACQLIEDQKTDIVIVLGYDFESEIPKNGMKRVGALSEKCIAPFSINRTGTDLADGIGCIVLENCDSAKKRNAHVYAKIMGYGVFSDAYNATSPDPSGRALYRAMKNAIKMSGINKTDICYINAHGSGTKLNDMLETEIIKKVFGSHANKLYINSSKSIIGHTLGAAGVVELVITLIEMRESIIHPTANYIGKDEMCDLNYCFELAIYKVIKYALSNSIGFGGINVSILLRKGEVIER